MLTTKFAGGSYLNKVELQIGRLASGHSNIYITPTTYGTNYANGKLDEAKLHQNASKIVQAIVCHLNYRASGQRITEMIVLLTPPSKIQKKFGKTSHATFTQIDVENIAR